MQENFLPTRYHLEVYENSFANNPSYFMQSSTPFSAVAVGDYFNHRTHDDWQDRPQTETEKFVVKEVEHIFWTIEDSHNSHKIMILLRKEPYTW